MNSNIPHIKISYTGNTPDLTYFNGAHVKDMKNSLMLFDITKNNKTLVPGLYWVDENSYAHCINNNNGINPMTMYSTLSSSVEANTNSLNEIAGQLISIKNRLQTLEDIISNLPELNDDSDIDE